MKPISTIACIALICLVVAFYKPKGLNIPHQEINNTHSHFELIYLDTPSPVEASIRYYSEEYGVDTKTALRIAKCESQMGKYKINWSGSSAKGVYQFIDKTWEHYCDGDVMNDEDNIICFMKLYENNKNWWLCI